MLRVLLTIVLPLVLPTALYLLWVSTLGTPQEGGAMSWTAVPWIWLAGAGAVLSYKNTWFEDATCLR